MKIYKTLVALVVISFGLVSCATSDEHRAGGGAYDESAFARGMDANNPATDEGHDRSYGGWRNIND